MRRIACLLPLLVLAAAPAQGGTPPPPTPTPHPLEVCASEGVMKCIPPVVKAYGVPGLLALAAIGLLAYLVISPLGELLRERVREWLRKWLFRPATGTFPGTGRC
ncbi:MAG: hypothetical protein HY784_02985 [Chloroflexi bacterium]|nr:hypothetical protein [Chloroflexota bacterium]